MHNCLWMIFRAIWWAPVKYFLSCKLHERSRSRHKILFSILSRRFHAIFSRNIRGVRTGSSLYAPTIIWFTQVFRTRFCAKWSFTRFIFYNFTHATLAEFSAYRSRLSYRLTLAIMSRFSHKFKVIFNFVDASKSEWKIRRERLYFRGRNIYWKDSRIGSILRVLFLSEKRISFSALINMNRNRRRALSRVVSLKMKLFGYEGRENSWQHCVWLPARNIMFFGKFFRVKIVHNKPFRQLTWLSSKLSQTVDNKLLARLNHSSMFDFFQYALLEFFPRQYFHFHLTLLRRWSSRNFSLNELVPHWSVESNGI